MSDYHCPLHPNDRKPYAVNQAYLTMALDCIAQGYSPVFDFPPPPATCTPMQRIDVLCAVAEELGRMEGGAPFVIEILTDNSFEFLCSCPRCMP